MIDHTIQNRNMPTPPNPLTDPVNRLLRLLTFILMISAITLSEDACAESASETLDSVTVERLMMSRGDNANGVIFLRIYDGETDTLIRSAEVYFSPRSRTIRPTEIREWQGRWAGPGYYWLKVFAGGYGSVEVDSLRVPPDSLTIITLRLHSGAEPVTAVEARECCVEISYDGLDDVLPMNKITGTVLDDSTGEPVAESEVYCEVLKRRTSTNSLGQFTLALDTLRNVTLHVWHSHYDSIRFSVSKEGIRSEKKVHVHFERMRDYQEKEPADETKSPVLLIVGWKPWSSWVPRYTELDHNVYTYRVRPGEVFGPTSSWTMGDCLPFRLVKFISDSTAWVQFASFLGPVGERVVYEENLLALDDTTEMTLSTRSLDGGATVTLQLLPDFSPRNNIDERIRRNPGRLLNEKSSESEEWQCNKIRAEVERVHMRNLLHIHDRRFESLARAFSEDFRSKSTKFVPTADNLARLYTQERLERSADKRITQIVDIKRGEVYVHGQCDEPMHERFADIMKAVGLEPQAEDVLVYFPWARSSHGINGWTFVYRKEADRWLILAGW